MRAMIRVLNQVTRRYLLGMEGLLVLLLTLAAFALAMFVHHRMTQIREALPGEVLAHQSDISSMLVDFSELVRAVQVARAESTPRLDTVEAALQKAMERLRGVRQTYSFDSLTGTSAAHAVATPALQDIEQWLEQGLPGFEADDAVVLVFVERRAWDAFHQIQRLVESTNTTAAALLEGETVRLARLRDSTVVYLGIFPLFAIGLVVLLVRKRAAETELRDSEERFRGAFEGGGVSVALLAMDGRLIRINEAFQNFLGYREDELAEMGFQGVTHEEDRGSSASAWEQLLSGSKSSFQLEKRYVHKDGNTLWGLVNVTLLRNVDGSPRSFIAQIQDITDEKLAQAELQEREEQYRRIFEATTDGLFIFSASRALVDVNPAVCALYGRSREEMLDMDPKALFHADSLEVFDELIEAISSRKPFHGELRGVRANGTIFDAEIFGAPYFMRGELHFLSSVRDVTERRKAEHILATTAQEFEQFAYLAAHDLKAPLRAMHGFSDLLMEDYHENLDDTGREYLGFIRDGAARMDELIESLLEYSRVGRSGLTFESVDMTAVFRHVLQDLEPDVDVSGAIVQIDDMLPTIEGHRPMLEEVFRNLVANAIKFTAPDTTPLVQVTAREINGEHVLSISDNGIGIDEEHRSAIFDIFQRLHSPDQYAGTGIGLAIVKKVVELHGGSVWIDPNPSGGSIVSVRFPAAQWQAVA